MPFDTIAAKKVINALHQMERRPGGDLMLMAAQHLESAVADVGNSMALIRTAESEAITAKDRLAQELLETKRLREILAVKDTAIVALVQVAQTKKGAAKIAQDWLAARGLLPKTEEKPVATATPTIPVKP